MSRPSAFRTSSSTNLGANSTRVLEGKIGIVTGASRGIGAAICHNLASKGCNLVMNYTSDSSKEKTEKLAQELQSNHGIQTLPVQADMGSENGPAHIVNIALNHFAHPKTRKLQIDVVVSEYRVRWYRE